MSQDLSLRPLGRRAQARSKILAEYTSDRLGMLCEAAGFGPHSAHVTETFRDLISPWGQQRIDHDIGWMSDIADDNTPIEFSAAIADKDIEVRALFEAQAATNSVADFRTTGLEFQERLERDYGADLTRFRLIQDLFIPENIQGVFAVWNSVVFSRRRPPQFKAYLNPQAQGVSESHRLVREGLRRLGLDNVWDRLEQTALRRGPHVDELKYFALDLMPGGESRVKVYVRHHDVTATDLEIAASAAENYEPDETREFVEAMSGHIPLLHERAAFTCSSFVESCHDRPKATTVYVPICAYARDDNVVLTRVCDYLEKQGISSTRYEAIVRGFANRPLQEGVGMQPWIAFRRHGGVRLTTYLASEAYHVHQPGTVPAPTARDSRLEKTLKI